MSDSGKAAGGGGIGIGAVIAGILSWSVNHSILFCFLHILCGWLYVIYYCFTYLK